MNKSNSGPHVSPNKGGRNVYAPLDKRPAPPKPTKPPKHYKPTMSVAVSTAEGAREMVELLRSEASAYKVKQNPELTVRILNLITHAVQEHNLETEVLDLDLKEFLRDSRSHWESLGYNVEAGGQNISW